MWGPRPMVGLSDNVAADRLMGYDSQVVVENPDRWSYEYVNQKELDHIIPASQRFRLFIRTYEFIKILFRFDILVSFFNGTFFASGLLQQYELKLIKLAGIKLIAVSYGSDVIPGTSSGTRFDWIKRLSIDYPRRKDEAFDKLLQGDVLRLMDSCDFIVPGGSPLKGFLQGHDLDFKYCPINSDLWTPQFETKNDVPVIVHAPNHRNIKGTDYLIEACEQLKQDGIAFELKLVEKVSRAEVKEIYSKADIIADQFLMGAYGMFALEGMALGKPVLTYLDENTLNDPVFGTPLVNTHPENIYEVLKVLISLPELRIRLGKAGRDHIEKHQAYKPIGEVWERIYQHLWFRKPLNLETTAVFSPDRQPRSLCEAPRKSEFWPVDVSDLIDDIQQILTKETITT